MKALVPTFLLAITLGIPLAAMAQFDGPMPPPRSDKGNTQAPPPPANAPLPRSDTAGSGESSSKDTKISDESSLGNATAGGSASDVGEVHPWDPHRADKNVEVGDYYFKKKNYAAAISRYREALYWKRDDAVALFRLGQALEAVGRYAEARKEYARYLEVLAKGPFAAEARKALVRLKDKPDAPKQPETPVLN